MIYNSRRFLECRGDFPCAFMRTAERSSRTPPGPRFYPRRGRNSIFFHRRAPSRNAIFENCRRRDALQRTTTRYNSTLIQFRDKVERRRDLRQTTERQPRANALLIIAGRERVITWLTWFFCCLDFRVAWLHSSRIEDADDIAASRPKHWTIMTVNATSGKFLQNLLLNVHFVGSLTISSCVFVRTGLSVATVDRILPFWWKNMQTCCREIDLDLEFQDHIVFHYILLIVKVKLFQRTFNNSFEKWQNVS